jgi:hypothetical protein
VTPRRPLPRVPFASFPALLAIGGDEAVEPIALFLAERASDQIIDGGYRFAGPPVGH